ncbi:MAG TPA: RAD55 family ATPase [Candidatus Dormibacteraeota bacterium]|nr:RAD55 family ATPase [Candidatus Dormibacteraeota bacterium]
MRVEHLFPLSEILVVGGINNGCFLLTGKSGVGKSVFAEEFIHDGLLAGVKGIYVHTSVPTEGLMDQAASLGLKLDEPELKERLVLIDVYASLAGLPSTSQIVLQQGATLNDLSHATSQATKDLSGFRFVLDDLASVLAFSTPQVAFKFTQILVSRLKAQKATGIFTLIPGVLSPEQEKLLPTLFDGQLELDVEETEKGLMRRFRIRTMRGAKHRTDWIQVDIREGGLQVVEQKTESTVA